MSFGAGLERGVRSVADFAINPRSNERHHELAQVRLEPRRPAREKAPGEVHFPRVHQIAARIETLGDGLDPFLAVGAHELIGFARVRGFARTQERVLRAVARLAQGVGRAGGVEDRLRGGAAVRELFRVVADQVSESRDLLVEIGREGLERHLKGEPRHGRADAPQKAHEFFAARDGNRTEKNVDSAAARRQGRSLHLHERKVLRGHAHGKGAARRKSEARGLIEPRGRRRNLRARGVVKVFEIGSLCGAEGKEGATERRGEGLSGRSARRRKPAPRRGKENSRVDGHGRVLFTIFK